MKANSRSSVLGNFSFDGDSLPDFSEFDSDSVIEEYHRESSCRPSDDKMAPTQTIETVTITRPLKLSNTAATVTHQTQTAELRYHQATAAATATSATSATRATAVVEEQDAEEMAEIRNPIAQVIAFICGLMVIGLLLMALVSTDWLMAAGWRQGLFAHCIGENSPTPLPFNVPNQGPDCYKARDALYMKVAAALCIVGLITDVIATLLTGLGLRSNDHRTKYKYYRIAVYVMILSLICVLLALVVYPVFFATELNEGNRTVWEFGWAYGVGWGAAIFLFGAVVLLLCDKESEEIYYKERKVAA